MQPRILKNGTEMNSEVDKLEQRNLHGEDDQTVQEHLPEAESSADVGDLKWE
jgi:hypothetical protein